MSSNPKLPPQNLEAEQCVLGAILLDNSGIAKAQAILVLDDFYRRAHQLIYQDMLALADRSEPIDQITLSNALKEGGHLEDVGGSAYLAELVQVVPSSVNITYHCRIVKEKSVRRALIVSAYQISNDGYDDTVKTETLLGYAEQSIFTLVCGAAVSGFKLITQALQGTLDYIERLSKRKEELTGIPTGFVDLDALTAGWQRSDLIVIAARPSMGKTSLALCCVLAALKRGLRVGMFSLEMSERQVTQRMLSMTATIDLQVLRTGRLQKEEWWRLANAAGELEHALFHLNDASALTAQQMRGEAKRLKMEHGLDLLVIDYIQLMTGHGNEESRQQEIADISRSLKALAKDLDVPVIALSQLNRACEQRTDKRPVLADLRESGAIEQDADMVIFIYRDEVYDKNSEHRGTAEILVRKHRNGPIDELKLAWIARFARFADLDTKHGGT